MEISTEDLDAADFDSIIETGEKIITTSKINLVLWTPLVEEAKKHKEAWIKKNNTPERKKQITKAFRRQLPGRPLN